MGAHPARGDLDRAPVIYMTVRRSADGLHLGLNQGRRELLPAGGRRAAALGGGRLRRPRARRVILTGMGHDGLASPTRLREAGGQPRAGRAQQRRLGHAGKRRAGWTRRSRWRSRTSA